MIKIDGPARLIVFPDPINKPVPIAPPIAMSCKWRLDKLRFKSPCSEVDSVFSKLILDVVFYFQSPKLPEKNKKIKIKLY